MTATAIVEELGLDLGNPVKCEVTVWGKPCTREAFVRIRWTDCLCLRVRTAFLCKDCLERIPVIGYSCGQCHVANFKWVTL